jgi:hypothetical protein
MHSVLRPPHHNDENNQIGTAMMKLNQAEDAMVEALQTLLELSPDTKETFEGYVSPRIRARLELDCEEISVASDFDSTDQLQPEVDSELIPFTKGRKEKRKPSYRIH